jgi:hypothetical protein
VGEPHDIQEPMKERYRHIRFAPWGGKWVCMSTHKPETKLGFVEYFQPWRQWQFCPEPMTGYTFDCLQDIGHFISQLPTP